MRTSLVLLHLALIAGGCASDPRVDELADRAAVIDTVTSLFVATDNRDWKGVKAVFADTVLFDMTSLAGGTPARITPQQIADAWDEGLRGLKAVHHQTGNFLVTLRGAEADVTCYAIAIHYLPNPSGMNTRSFVGSYDIHLKKEAGGWRIDRFRFNQKYVAGNINLQPPAMTAYDCGNNVRFAVVLAPDRAEVTFEGRRYSLPAVQAASGARFSDGTTTFWMKGREALLVVGGKSYQNCIERATE
jgi:membrane-bound inhibitor of C-type lysozyme